MRTVLVVDDEELMLKMVRRVLGGWCEVVCAGCGEEALELCDGLEPDLFMVDLDMPGMSGFELARHLNEKYGGRVPMIFMDEDIDGEAEELGFAMGAEDFIHKPIMPNALVHRVKRILNNYDKIRTLTEESTMDGLTGFFNKMAVNERLQTICSREKGTLLIIDLDSFKLVNDLYGHEMGDELLVRFADMIRRNTRENDILGRVGGDEFVAFLENVVDEKTVARLTGQINDRIMHIVQELLGEDCLIPIGASVGAVFVPAYGTDYTELFHLADKALYFVKQNGKHGYRIYGEESAAFGQAANITEELRRVSMVLEERNIRDQALILGQEGFKNVYHFLIRYMQRYGGGACKVLLSVVPNDGDESGENYRRLVEQLEKLLRRSLRNSDIIMQSKSNQFFVILPNVQDGQIASVINRTVDAWKATDYGKQAQLLYETELIGQGA